MLAALWLAARALLHYPALPHAHVISVHDTVGVAQLVFASVAGAGALVALVVAYRRQRVAEDRTPVFNERFTAIAAQLGDDQPAVRLAGVHAMAGLADYWMENRQTCVDVLCAYLRLPYDPDPGDAATPADRAAYRANREVRHTIIRLIGDHLRPEAAVSWQGLNLDFTGVIFDGGNFSGVRFSDGFVRFDGAEFSRGAVSFGGAIFSGGRVLFGGAVFSGGRVYFDNAVFSGGEVAFNGAVFSGAEVGFGSAEFSGGKVYFHDAVFSSGRVGFDVAVFSRGTVSFGSAEFSGAEVSFFGAKFSGGRLAFGGAVFSRGRVGFDGAEFSGGKVYFGAKFSGGKVAFSAVAFLGGEVSFDDAVFSGGEVGFDAAAFLGGVVSFIGAVFSGGDVNFRGPTSWSYPPIFDWDGTPPAGVTLPADAMPRRPDSLGPETAR